MPSPKESPKKATKYAERAKLTVGEPIDAFVAHTVNPSEFYIHKSDAQETLDVITAALAGLTDRKKISKPDEGMPCMAMFEGSWFRGQVVSISDEGARVLYVDYGNTELVPIWGIYQLPAELGEHATQAIPCSLAWVKPVAETWSELATSRFKNETAYDDILYHVETAGPQGSESTTDPWPVFLSIGKTCLNDFMFRRGLAIRSLPTYGKVKIDIGQSKSTPGKILAPESPDQFYVQSGSDDRKRKMEKVSKKLEAFGKKEGPKLPLAGHEAYLPMPCIAQFDSDYVRGLALSVDEGSMVSIFCIDTGAIKSIATDCLSIAPAELLKTDPLAWKCKLFGIEPCEGSEYSTEAKEILQGLEGLENVEFSVIYTDAEKINYVALKTTGDESFDVSERLVERGLATKVEPKFPSGHEFPPKTTFVGVISFTYTPDKFFIHHTGFSSDLDRLNADFAKYPVTKLVQEPKVGDKCASKYEGVWYRSIIESVNDEEKVARVFYVDYGNSEDVPFGELYVLPYAFYFTKPCALPCSLAFLGLPEGSETWCPEAIGHIETLMEGDVMVTIYQVPSEADPTYKVDLVQGGASARQKMLDEKWALETGSIESEEEPELKRIPPPVVKENAKFGATWATEFGEIDTFYVHDMNKAKELESLIIDTTISEEAPVAEDVAERSEVLSKFEGEYYRARVLSVEEGEERKATVFYVDYANQDTVLVGTLKQLPPPLRRIPQQAIPCKLKATLSENEKATCAEILADVSNFEVKIMGSTEGVFFVRILLNGRDLVSDVLPEEEAELEEVVEEDQEIESKEGEEIGGEEGREIGCEGGDPSASQVVEPEASSAEAPDESAEGTDDVSVKDAEVEPKTDDNTAPDGAGTPVDPEPGTVDSDAVSGDAEMGKGNETKGEETATGEPPQDPSADADGDRKLGGLAAEAEHCRPEE